MQIVIDIPDKQYELIKQSDYNVFSKLASKECMMYAIKNGVSLQKWHGRLIDADELIEHAWRDRLDSRERIAEMIENAPTIIPADKEAENADNHV